MGSPRERRLSPRSITSNERSDSSWANICSSYGVIRRKLLPLVTLTYLAYRQVASTPNNSPLHVSQRRALRDVPSSSQALYHPGMGDTASALLHDWNSAAKLLKDIHQSASGAWDNAMYANNTHTHTQGNGNNATQSQSDEAYIKREKVVDILQIGSNKQPDLMIAQQQSFGSHVAIRHIFNATEDDDADQLCNSKVLKEDAMAISKFCRRGEQFDLQTHPLMRFMRNNYARPQWLEKKENPVGWLCAQKRPLHGLYKVVQKYRNDEMELPDHLIVADDDSYYNIEEFLKQYIDDTPEKPLVRAGCLVRMPIHMINFTFPFGGYGLVFNRPSLKVLMEPIRCPRDTEICERISDNQLGEQPVFQDGMALIDLMQAFASFQPYSDFMEEKWTTGYCLHSDW